MFNYSFEETVEPGLPTDQLTPGSLLAFDTCREKEDFIENPGVLKRS